MQTTTAKPINMPKAVNVTCHIEKGLTEALIDLSAACDAVAKIATENNKVMQEATSAKKAALEAFRYPRTEEDRVALADAIDAFYEANVDRKRCQRIKDALNARWDDITITRTKGRYARTIIKKIDHADMVRAEKERLLQVFIEAYENLQTLQFDARQEGLDLITRENDEELIAK